MSRREQTADWVLDRIPLVIRLAGERSPRQMLPSETVALRPGQLVGVSQSIPGDGRYTYAVEPGFSAFPIRPSQLQVASFDPDNSVAELGRLDLLVPPNYASGLRAMGGRLQLEVHFASRRNPTRRLAAPVWSMGAHGSQLVLSSDTEPFTFADVRPVAPLEEVLLQFLIRGNYRAAQLTAASLVSEWRKYDVRALSKPSYGQILVGYALAMSRDHLRLSAWCRRVDAFNGLLGPDGTLLYAFDSWLRKRPETCAKLLRDLLMGPPPALWLGINLGVDMMESILFEASLGSASNQRREGSEDHALSVNEVQEMGHALSFWRTLQYKTNGRAAVVSLSTTPHESPDIRTQGVLEQLRWLLRFLGQRHTLTFRRSIDQFGKVYWKELVVDNPESKPQTRGVINDNLRIVTIWLAGAASVAAAVWWVNLGLSAANTVQTLITIALAAMSLIVVASVVLLRRSESSRRSELEQRLRKAEEALSREIDAASRGRALAAVLQADYPKAIADIEDTKGKGSAYESSEMTPLERHARLSHTLFGRLI